MTIQERRKAYLDSKVAYYSEDLKRRAVQGELCVYRTKDGRKCAIGLDIDENHPQYKEIVECEGGVDDLIKNYPTALSKEIQELSLEFLGRVQDLHDNSTFWEEGGLNRMGTNYCKKIIDEYCS